jgi:hypothetical protein
MAIFNSKLLVYQRVFDIKINIPSIPAVPINGTRASDRWHGSGGSQSCKGQIKSAGDWSHAQPFFE